MITPPVNSTKFWERYDQWRTPGSNYGITNVSYQKYEITNPSGLRCASSMLTTYELALLYALAKDYWSGHGCIIDTGSLNGLSVNALAKGLQDNPGYLKNKRDKIIYAFDLFQSNGLPSEFFDGSQNVTGSFLDAFLANNRDYLDTISITAGNILSFHWQGEDVEIFFNDVSKSWEINHWIQRNILPFLIPGKSILIQQDYCYFHSYWVAITMEYFSDYFELMYPVFGSSFVYLYKMEIPSFKLQADLFSLPLATKLELLDRAIAKAPPSSAEVLKCAKAYCLLDNNQPNLASEVLSTVVVDSFGEDPIRDFSGIAKSNKAIVAELITKI
jgi:hypothetical protein